MKTFTRRRSSKQLSSTEPNPENLQQPSQPASRKPKGSSQQLHAAVERDPYSFEEIEDDTVAARPEQPGPPKVTTTKGEARPQVCGLGSSTTRQPETPAVATDMLALLAGQTWQQEAWQHRQPCNLNSY